MTFNAYETSIEAGRPIEFYTFTLGDVVWRYTSADVEWTFESNVYTPAAITCPNVQQTGEPTMDALILDVPSWIAPAQLFMSAPPSRKVQVVIAMLHADDTEAIVHYNGEIGQVNFPMPGRARITCESLMASMDREGLRHAWQRSCTHALYDPLTCKVNKATYGVPFTVLTISGFTVGIELTTAQPDGHFSNGFIEWSHPIRGTEYLAVEDHDAATPGGPDEPNAVITLFEAPGEMFEGAMGTIYPGCNFTPANCRAFGNYDNFGGNPDMPGKSPFDGDPVF